MIQENEMKVCHEILATENSTEDYQKSDEYFKRNSRTIVMNLAREKHALDEKIESLEFVINVNPNVVSEENKELWKIQLEVMKKYSEILKKRIIINL